MLDPGDPYVLAWLRKTPRGDAVIAICNFTAEPRKASFDLVANGVTARKIVTLLKSPGTDDPKSLKDVHLKPFGVYLLQVR